MDNSNPVPETTLPFYNQPEVHVERIPIGPGIPIGIQKVFSSVLGIGGAYGTWGFCYDNVTLSGLIEQVLGERVDTSGILHLSELGFVHRHHIPILSKQENVDLEVEVGARFLQEAATACGWEPGEVDGLLVGLTGPVADDYTVRIAEKAGIPEEAVKVSIHKACDSSVGGLNLALNPDLPEQKRMGRNLAKELYGKKVLVGGIEGLSRVMQSARDLNALQLFGNGAGVIGLIPGKTIRFLVGKTHEAYDEEGVLEVRMKYPHSGKRTEGESMIEVSQAGKNHFRIAGLMHEPEIPGSDVVMAGPMGMVKLFVRTGVQVVQDVYQSYQAKISELNLPGKSIAVAIVHHANYKINKLLEKNLNKEGIHLHMPWLLCEFGNVSAASNMIAFLRELTQLKPGDHVLIDGFGAGTYYDALAVELGG